MIKKDYFKIQRDFVGFPNLIRLSGAAVKLYLILRSAINEGREDNSAWPSYEFIRHETGLSKASISKAQQELIAQGWIDKIDHRFNNSNIYHLNDIQFNASSVNDSSGSVNEPLEVQKVNTNKNNITILNNKNNNTINNIYSYSSVNEPLVIQKQLPLPQDEMPKNDNELIKQINTLNHAEIINLVEYYSFNEVIKIVDSNQDNLDFRRACRLIHEMKHEGFIG